MGNLAGLTMKHGLLNWPIIAHVVRCSKFHHTYILTRPNLFSIVFHSAPPLSFLRVLFVCLFSQFSIIYNFHSSSKPIQTVIIVYDSFSYHARLNKNFHALSLTIINYHDRLNKALGFRTTHLNQCIMQSVQRKNILWKKTHNEGYWI